MVYPHDFFNNNWQKWLSDLDKTMIEIEKIDREFDYKRLSFILRHDPINHGYDEKVLELLK